MALSQTKSKTAQPQAAPFGFFHQPNLEQVPERLVVDGVMELHL